MIEVTPSFVLYWWHMLNHALFDGILYPPTKIHCRNFHDGSYGWCLIDKDKNTDDVELGLRRLFESRKQFITVLVHEMVHQHEWVYNRDIDHKDCFYSWKSHIKRILNLPLTEFIDDE